MNNKIIGGVTESERMLSQFCEKSFLKLWTYPNPYKDDGKELCDLIAVFGNHVFIFFDRNNALPQDDDKDPLLLWNRWKKKVIDKQIHTAHGAERYIRSGRPIFLNGKKTLPFPIPIDIKTAIFHKIVVAHGAKEACLRSSPNNIYGSLAVVYLDLAMHTTPETTHPFSLVLDKENPVHILDSHNLSIILTELDTVSDLADYLDEKVSAIKRHIVLSYCGEEDLLAHYYVNYDEKGQKHRIGTDKETVSGIMIGEGEWRDYVGSDVYRATKQANKASYLWDELIQKTCQYSIDGKLLGNANLLDGPSAIYEMVKEPRYIRRALAEGMMQSIESFPNFSGAARKVSLMPSINPTTAYVFLQLKLTEAMQANSDARAKRQTILEIACGSAKNKFPDFTKIIGIGMEPPKYSTKISEDFILMPCENWTLKLKEHYEILNKGWNFFQTPAMTKREVTISEFVHPTQPQKTFKAGRNEPCPCGSQKKYKKCCGT
ncbi:YecA family protein [Pseudomonas yamanorum]|uniref:YecA family protein n=1 Tax=Pseudomonas yamanorum TaxID=515393 RepID=UPI003BA2548C